jgi:spermidine synthase
MWTFIAATHGEAIATRPTPVARIEAMESELRYFNTDIARAMFALPTYVRRALYGEKRHELPAMCDDPATYGE